MTLSQSPLKPDYPNQPSCLLKENLALESVFYKDTNHRTKKSINFFLNRQKGSQSYYHISLELSKPPKKLWALAQIGLAVRAAALVKLVSWRYTKTGGPLAEEPPPSPQKIRHNAARFRCKACRCPMPPSQCLTKEGPVKLQGLSRMLFNSLCHFDHILSRSKGLIGLFLCSAGSMYYHVFSLLLTS